MPHCDKPGVNVIFRLCGTEATFACPVESGAGDDVGVVCSFDTLSDIVAAISSVGCVLHLHSMLHIRV